MTEWAALAISALALVVSAVTAWLTIFRAGQLRMTQPTMVFFGPDGERSYGKRSPLKVFLRTLLYSTARRGQTVESMHVNLQRGESKQNFSIWIYGDDQVARGSGLHVGHEGIVCNHHFLLPRDGADFPLLAGQYTLRVYAKRVTDREPRELARLILSISESQANELQRENAGIFFDWEPDQQAYQAYVEKRKAPPLPPRLIEAIEAGYSQGFSPRRA